MDDQENLRQLKERLEKITAEIAKLSRDLEWVREELERAQHPPADGAK